MRRLVVLVEPAPLLLCSCSLLLLLVTKIGHRDNSRSLPLLLVTKIGHRVVAITPRQLAWIFLRRPYLAARDAAIAFNVDLKRGLWTLYFDWLRLVRCVQRAG